MKLHAEGCACEGYETVWSPEVGFARAVGTESMGRRSWWFGHHRGVSRDDVILSWNMSRYWANQSMIFMITWLSSGRLRTMMVRYPCFSLLS